MKRTFRLISFALAAFLFSACSSQNSTQQAIESKEEDLAAQQTAPSAASQPGEPQGSDAAILQNTRKSLVIQALASMDSLETVLEELEDDDIITEEEADEVPESQSFFNLDDAAEIYSSQSEGTDQNKTFTFTQDGEEITLYLCLQPAEKIVYEKGVYYALLD